MDSELEQSPAALMVAQTQMSVGGGRRLSGQVYEAASTTTMGQGSLCDIGRRWGEPRSHGQELLSATGIAPVFDRRLYADRHSPNTCFHLLGMSLTIGLGRYENEGCECKQRVYPSVADA